MIEKHERALMSAIDTLTKQRDAYAKAADSMAAAHKVERDKHCNCEFEGDENTVQCTLHNAWAEALHEQAGFRRERDALKAAARLALDALSDVRYVPRYSQITDAINALKAVL